MNLQVVFPEHSVLGFLSYYISSYPAPGVGLLGTGTGVGRGWDGVMLYKASLFRNDLGFWSELKPLDLVCQEPQMLHFLYW